jgi:hypothetical protein
LAEGESSPSAPDRALLRAIRAWGGGDFDGCSSRFSEDWRERLRTSWVFALREHPDDAWSALRSDHEASARFDLARVHPSWLVRILKSESPAVRLAVVANASLPLREILQRELGIDLSQLAADREPDPEAPGWALALWAERLVGDVPSLDSDPPVVVALTRMGPRHLARLVRACGVAKHAFALVGNGIDESLVRFTAHDRVRFGYFQRQIGVADPRLGPIARLDLEVIEGDRRRGLARVGLVTFGRLLAAVEPHRARWASQHIPYPIAKLMRIKETPPISSKSLIVWESWVLETAWHRLLCEGRLTGTRVSRSQNVAGTLA